MAQILPPATNIGTDIGRAIGQGFQQGIPQGMHQQYQKGQLQKAFGGLDKEGDFLQQLQQIAPALLTTPGGAQALAEISPLLSRYGQTKAQLDQLEKWQAGNVSGANAPTVPGKQQPGEPLLTVPEGQHSAKKPISAESKYRNPSLTDSDSSTFPQRTTGPQPQREMSPQDKINYAADIVRSSLNTSNPISIGQAQQQAEQIAKSIVDNNDRIRMQQKDQQQATDLVTDKLVTQAKNRELLVNPEDDTYAKKLAFEVKDESNPAKQIEHVRTGLRKLQTHRKNIEKEFDLGNPITNLYRKWNGTYKDKETIMRNMQHDLDFYRENGLFNEARVMLGEIGMGAEDRETTLFPPTKEEKKYLSEFPDSPNRPMRHEQVGAIDRIPGEKNNIKDIQKFEDFKDRMSEYFLKNPEANLLVMRGYLGEEKGYSWPDMSRAYDELVAEGRVSPDYVQDVQKKDLNNSPLPGMAQIFNFLFKGTR